MTSPFQVLSANLLVSYNDVGAMPWAMRRVGDAPGRSGGSQGGHLVGTTCIPDGT